MPANDRQVGGEHYIKKYQHWDFVCDTGMHYLLGCATKYVTRWREKNGLEDLEKPIHYLEKAVEQCIEFPKCDKDLIMNYVGDMRIEDAAIIINICNNEFDMATIRIAHLIAEEQERLDDLEAGPTSGYVDQD